MTTRTESNRALAPVLLLARRSGFQPELIRQLAGLGIVVSRKQVNGWLTPTARLRREPGLGMGLLLLRAAELARAEIERRRTVIYGPGSSNGGEPEPALFQLKPDFGPVSTPN